MLATEHLTCGIWEVFSHGQHTELWSRRDRDCVSSWQLIWWRVSVSHIVLLVLMAWKLEGWRVTEKSWNLAPCDRVRVPNDPMMAPEKPLVNVQPRSQWRAQHVGGEVPELNVMTITNSRRYEAEPAWALKALWNVGSRAWEEELPKFFGAQKIPS